MDVINEAILAASGAWWILPAVFALSLVDGLFPVVPSETAIVALAAVGASAGGPHAVALALAGAAGAFCGDQAAYRIGRRVGTGRFQWMRTRRAARAFAVARRELASRGALLVFTARYVPVGRVAVNATAGATRFPARRFLVLDSLACLAWGAYSAALGALAGHWFEENRLLRAAASIAVALALGWLLDRAVRALLRRPGPAGAGRAPAPEGAGAGHRAA